MTSHSSSRRLVSAVGLLLASASATSGVQAQDAVPHDATVLETIVVKGRRLARPASETDKRYTVSQTDTATGLPLAPKDTPQSTGVVTRQQIKDEGVTTIADALKRSTGVSVIRDSGTMRFQSRGFYMDQVQEDGANAIAPGAAINPYRSATGYSDIDIYDRIEILRGPTGLVQGTGEPGGTVNLIRKRPTEEFQASSTTSIGSWNHYREAIDVSGSLNPEKTLRGRVVGIGDRMDSFKDDVRNWNGTLYGVMEADVGDGSTLRFGGLYEKRGEVPDYFGLPMAKDGSDAHLPRSTWLGADWNRLDREKVNGFVEFEHVFDNDWKLDLSGSFTHSQSVSPFAALVAGSGLAKDRLAAVNNMLRYDNEGDQRALQAKLQGSYELFGRDHEFFAGLSYSASDYDARSRRVLNRKTYNVDSFTGGEIAQPDWSNSRLLNWDINYRSRFAETAANLGTRFNVTDSLHLIAGGRFTHYDYEGITHYTLYNGRPDGETAREELTRDRAIPYLGLTYDLLPDVTLYASYTDIFKPQPQTDVNHRVLPPLEGENLEVGVKTSLLDGRVNTSLAVFRIRQKNRAIYDIATDSNFADGEVESRGVDIEVSGEVADGWNLFAGYTYNHSEYLKRESAKLPAGASFSTHTPEHLFRLNTTYRLPFADGKWTVGGGVQAQSESESLYGIRQGGFAVWNASLRYDFDDKTSLRFIANNLFDRRYYENNRTRTVGLNNFYGEPRSYMLTLARKF